MGKDAIEEAVQKMDENRENENKAPVEKVLTPREKLVKDIRGSVLLLTDAVQKRDRRLQTRALGHITSLRKRLVLSVLKENLAVYLPQATQYLAGMQEEVKSEEMEVDSEPVEAKANKKESKQKKAPEPVKGAKVIEDEKKLEAAALTLHEMKLYFHLLVALYLSDKGRGAEAAACIDDLLTFLHSENRRTADLLSAKIYYYYSLFNERLGKIQELRTNLLAFHRTACLLHNEPGQGTLVVSILRNYLSYNLISQADNFRMKIRFPENVSNNVSARYSYYLGRIESVQLNYSDAFSNLTQAIRKAPMRKETAGFRQAVYKLLIIVQLLMGEVPERSIFGQTHLRGALKPYFQLTKAVRIGDLRKFAEVMSPENRAQFVADNTFSLIIRLRHNVIKTGLRKINVSYSKISIADICTKLQLDNQADAEYIVAKAIHDGVIDAVLDRSAHEMRSRAHQDLYATQEPAIEYHKRIEFLFQTHTEAVKALSFPPNAYKTQAELDAEAARLKEEGADLDPDAEYDED